MSQTEGFSVLVPGYNEEDTIENFLNSLISALSVVDEEHEIIVIDDGSTDKTLSIAGRFPNVRIVSHPYNKGYGASIKTGVQEAKYEKIITIDADGQHDPVHIPEMLELMKKNDLVAGARQSFISGRRGIGNRMFARLASYLSNIQIPDLTCGLRGFTKEKFIEFVHIFPNKSSLPSTTIMAYAISGYNVKFIPISDNPRLGGTSKVKIIKDGMRFFMLIIRLSSIFNPLKMFAPMSGLLFLLGMIWAVRTMIYSYRVSGTFELSATVPMLFMGAIFVFLFGLLADQIAQTRLTLGRMDKRLMEKLDNKRD